MVTAAACWAAQPEETYFRPALLTKTPAVAAGVFACQHPVPALSAQGDDKAA